MTIGMVLSLLAGMGLFLYGMQMMGDGLEKAAGNNLRRLLQTLTRNQLSGLLVGTAFTAVIQSSAATVVMVVGFVNAGMMTLAQSVGVIMGANIGTTITGHLVALRLSDIAPIFVFSGVVMLLFFKQTMVQRIGTVVAGFGILFLGMGMMSAAMQPLGEMPEFLAVMTSLHNPLLAVVAGAVFTALIQSSSGAVGVIQTMALGGLLPLDTSLYITLGTGVGTCITALLSSIGTTHAARRAAVIHLMLNVLGTAVLLLLMTFLPVNHWIGLTAGEGNISQQIANGNTLFKLFEVLVFLPMTGVLVKISEIMVPGEDQKAGKMRLMYLDERLLTTPPVVLMQLRREVERMGSLAIDNLQLACDCFFEHNPEGMRRVLETEAVVDFLNHEITRFLVAASRMELPAGDANQIGAMFHIVNDLERIGDHAENMCEIAQKRFELDIPFSEACMAEMHTMLAEVLTLCRLAIDTFKTGDHRRLSQALNMEEHIDELERLYQNRHVQRLTEGMCSPQSGMLYSDILSNLERVADHATNIAFSIEESTGDDKATAI